MTDQNQPTRRDWFRLKPASPTKPAAPQTPLASSTKTVAGTGLAPIELPPNHDGMDLNELPPLSEATLDTHQVANLFQDIGLLGTEVLLMQRKHPQGKATASQPSTAVQLESARDQLLSGQLRRLQIRYRWKDSLWIDTLEYQGESFRLIRIAHSGPTGAQHLNREESA